MIKEQNGRKDAKEMGKWGEAENTEYSQDVDGEQRGFGMRGKEENRRRTGLGKQEEKEELIRKGKGWPGWVGWWGWGSGGGRGGEEGENCLSH
jgi:hypothetical protein